MTPTAARAHQQTPNPFMAMAIAPVLLVNPLYALQAYMVGAAYTLNLMRTFHSCFFPQRQENRSVQPGRTPAPSGDRSKLHLVSARRSRATSNEATRTASA